MSHRLVLSAFAGLALSACASAPPVLDTQGVVMAAAETGPAGSRGDAADDPAVWRHPADASKSLILGTNKQEGLVVFALDGREVQRLPIGLINNIDLRASDTRPFDVAVASNDQVHAISVFLIDRASGAISHRGEIPAGRLEPYGICAGRETGRDLAAVTYKDGTIDLWSMTVSETELSGRLEGTAKLATQLEGCVFDEVNGTLVVGEEGAGLWAFAYRDLTAAPVAIDTAGSGTGLVADVEGVSIWRGADGEGWLVASAQAEDRFVVYDRKAPFAHRGSFSIGANPDAGIDAVTHTDGLDVFSGALPGYPRGILAVQDDGNPRKGQDQNFKIVSWGDVEAAIGLPVLAAE